MDAYLFDVLNGLQIDEPLQLKVVIHGQEVNLCSIPAKGRIKNTSVGRVKNHQQRSSKHIAAYPDNDTLHQQVVIGRTHNPVLQQGCQRISGRSKAWNGEDTVETELRQHAC